MNQRTVQGVADLLWQRELERASGPRIADLWAQFDESTAYAVQDANLARRLDAGESQIGLKLGLTSAAKQRRMGVHAPLTGWLTSGMLLSRGSPVPVAQLIHSRVEPEIVFVMGARLQGPGVTMADALAAVDSVHAGYEVIDSRFDDYRFGLPDVVADNASAARFDFNRKPVAPDDLDLRFEACLLTVNDEIVDTAAGAAVLGHPAQALAHAANALARRGHAIEKGWIVLTGGLTDAVPLNAQDRFTIEFASLGTVGPLSGGTS